MRFRFPLVLGLTSAVTACALFTDLDGYSGQPPSAPSSAPSSGSSGGDGGGPPTGPGATDAGVDATSASGAFSLGVTPGSVFGAGLFAGSGPPPMPVVYRAGVAVGGVGASNDNATGATPGGPGSVIVVVAKPP